MAIFSRGSQIQVTTTAGPQMSNPNQVGGTLCISIASTTLFGGYLRQKIEKIKLIVALGDRWTTNSTQQPTKITQVRQMVTHTGHAT